MFKRSTAINLTVQLSLAGLVAATGCDLPLDTASNQPLGTSQQQVADVPHTDVERQSIGNCWLYAQASWVESMNLSAQLANVDSGDGDGDGDGTTDPMDLVDPLDVSQSYWTYWHWFDQVTGYMYRDEVSTGGNQWQSHAIIRDRGLMREADFIPEDYTSEMSSRQASALQTINRAIKDGELSTYDARKDGKLVRKIFDDAWGLSDDVRFQLDTVFGEDGESTLRQGASVEGTHIIDAGAFGVQYTESKDGQKVVRETDLLEAVRYWQTVKYPRSEDDRRAFLQRVQRALHDGQPVVITWAVDFNAMENGDNDRRGAFNMQTLDEAGRPGSQGGHMTILEDYAAETEEYGLLEAGITLDPTDAEDAAKLEAALLPSTRIKLLRTKNSWGALRPDRAFAKGFPGYHDLWMDYLDGPIKYCPNVNNATNETCTDETVPLKNVMLPPGY